MRYPCNTSIDLRIPSSLLQSSKIFCTYILHGKHLSFSLPIRKVRSPNFRTVAIAPASQNNDIA